MRLSSSNVEAPDEEINLPPVVFFELAQNQLLIVSVPLIEIQERRRQQVAITSCNI